MTFKNHEWITHRSNRELITHYHGAGIMCSKNEWMFHASRREGQAVAIKSTSSKATENASTYTNYHRNDIFSIARRSYLKTKPPPCYKQTKKMEFSYVKYACNNCRRWGGAKLVLLRTSETRLRFCMASCLTSWHKSNSNQNKPYSMTHSFPFPNVDGQIEETKSGMSSVHHRGRVSLVDGMNCKEIWHGNILCGP